MGSRKQGFQHREQSAVGGGGSIQEEAEGRAQGDSWVADLISNLSRLDQTRRIW